MHRDILKIIYRTRDILYLIYSGGACQFKSRPFGLVWILTRPFTVNRIQIITCSVNITCGNKILYWGTKIIFSPNYHYYTMYSIQDIDLNTHSRSKCFILGCSYIWFLLSWMVVMVFNATFNIISVISCGDIPLDHSKNHLQNTWHFVSDLQWRGVSIQISSFRTRLNIDTPLHCKSDINYHLFCKEPLYMALKV
jgi:hypothetical protein